MECEGNVRILFNDFFCSFYNGAKLIYGFSFYAFMPKTLKITEIASDPSMNIVMDTLALGKQALVFVNTKRSAEKVAEDISKKIKEENNELDKLAEEVGKAVSRPTKQCERLALCLKKGIAFHHAGLAHKQKSLVEEHFRKGSIKIICATPTLAFGLDLPAYRVIVRDLHRYSQHGLAWIPILEVHQMFGRAGRPSFDKEGQALCIAATPAEKEKITERYLKGLPEDIFSKLAVEPVLRTYLLSLISSGFVSTHEQAVSFFGKTFWAHQYKDMEKLEGIIDKMLSLLEEWEFIMGPSDDFQSADSLDDAKYQPTALGKRVSELYIDPYTAHFMLSRLQEASSKKIELFALLHVISRTLELRPLLRARTKDFDKIQEYLLRYGNSLFDEEPSMYDPEYEEYMDSVKTSIMFDEWIHEKGEDYLLETYNIRPGELNAKMDVADWLLYSMSELVRFQHYPAMLKEILKLRFRLRYGVQEELLPLVRLENIGRIRARKLYSNGLKDLAAVRKADIMKLTQLLGKNIALNIKKQVDGEIKEVVPGKRKGQISLEDY